MSDYELSVINELLSGNYYTSLSQKDKDKKFELLLKWRASGSLDDELLKAYAKTKVIKLRRKPEISNMLELSLHLGRLFHRNELIHNKEGVCVYDSVFNNFPVSESLIDDDTVKA